MNEKIFINNTTRTLQIILFIRQAEHSSIESEMLSFDLLPSEKKRVVYVGSEETFIRGMLLYSVFSKNLFRRIYFISALNREEDMLLNSNRHLIIEETELGYTFIGNR